MIRTDCHTFDPIFLPPPPTSAQNPCFCQKLSPKVGSPIFVTLSRILEIFHSKTPNERKFEKKVPKCHLFLYGFCHWKTPYFFALHTHVCLRGMLLPQTRSETGKFCILETESSNLVNTFRCKFNKGDENKSSVLQAQPTQLCIIYMDEFHWKAGMIYKLLST